MFPFRKILFPVDYSDPCIALAPHVRAMARRHSAAISLVHAYQVPFQAYADSAILDPMIPEETQASEERSLRRFAKEILTGEHVETFAKLGEPGAVIDHFVRSEGTDLIMMPTHGRGLVRRFLLGSVTAKVLHDVSCAVWTATRAAYENRAPGFPHKSILCAVEDTEEAAEVLRGAAAVAGDYEAKLSIVHVLEMPTSTPNFDFTPYRQELLASANLKLRELKAQLMIDAPHVVTEGPIPDGIQAEAQRRNADLIVVGRGRAQGVTSRALSRLYRIVRESTCPVLSI